MFYTMQCNNDLEGLQEASPLTTVTSPWHTLMGCLSIFW